MDQGAVGAAGAAASGEFEGGGGGVAAGGFHADGTNGDGANTKPNERQTGSDSTRCSERETASDNFGKELIRGCGWSGARGGIQIPTVRHALRATEARANGAGGENLHLHALRGVSLDAHPNSFWRGSGGGGAVF